MVLAWACALAFGCLSYAIWSYPYPPENSISGPVVTMPLAGYLQLFQILTLISVMIGIPMAVAVAVVQQRMKKREKKRKANEV